MGFFVVIFASLKSLLRMTNLKIAYISPNFPPELGGMGTACFYTAHGVGKTHAVTVFLPQRKTNYTPGNFKIKIFKPWFSYGYADFAPHLIWQLKNFDIVHLYYPYYGVAEFLWLLKIFKHRPKIIFHHAMDIVGEGITKITTRIHRWLIQPWLFKSADAIFVLSKDYAENSDVTQLYQCCPQKFFEVPHGVDLSLFCHPELRRKSGEGSLKDNQTLGDSSVASLPQNDKNKNFVIFTAQGLDKQHYFKGIDVLIKSIHLLVAHYTLPITLIIAGDGNLKPHYEKLTRQLGVSNNVKFLGRVAQDELPTRYSQADIVAIPSTAATECFSITAVETMACGRPVIVANWPGVRVTIQANQTGLICEPGNTEDLAEKIKYLYDHPEIREQMGVAARKRVEEKYDWKIICEKIIRNYKLLIYNSPIQCQKKSV